MSNQWFDVDKAGLGKQAEQQSKGRLIGELVQNALDEAGVTRIAVTVALVAGRPLADLTVEDDSPEGFRNLAHAYTLFAESYKRGNPEQRGQYNFGAKLVLAVCESASISTTKGTVIFDPEEGRIEKPRQKRELGSVFTGRIKLTREEYPQVADYLRSLLLPEGIVVTFNGDRLRPRNPIRTFEASLETLVADEGGVMRSRLRKGQVSIFEPLPGEMPTSYVFPRWPLPSEIASQYMVLLLLEMQANHALKLPHRAAEQQPESVRPRLNARPSLPLLEQKKESKDGPESAAS